MSTTKVVPSALSDPEDQIRVWEVSADVDRCSREVIKAALLNDPAPYTADEESKISEGLRIVAKLSNDTNSEIKMTKVETGTQLQSAYMCYDNESHITYGKVAVTVHGASVLDVAAYISDYMSNFYEKHSPNPNKIESRILERINNHHQVWYYKGGPPPPFQPRDTVWSFIVKRLSDEQYVCVLQPTTHKDAPITSDVVRATTTRLFLITKVSENVARQELFITINMGGIIPSYITNSIIVPTALRVAQHIYFLQIKPYADYDKAGHAAAMLAQMLVDALSSSATAADRNFVVRQFFIRTAALRHAKAQHPWLPSLVVAFALAEYDLRPTTGINARVRSLFAKRTLPSAPLISVARAEDFTVARAEEAGRSLALCLSSNFTSTAAVEAWMKMYAALQQVEDDLPSLFRPFFESLAQCQLDLSLGLMDEEVKAFLTVDATLDDKGFAETVGTLLMKRSRMSTKQRLAAIYRQNPRLNEMFPYPIMPSLFSGMMENSFSTHAVTTPLASLTFADASTIGKHLSTCLNDNVGAESGLGQWKDQCPSMRELCMRDPQFATLSLDIAKKKLVVAPLGMYYRVGVGAVISTADVVTDVITIVRFFSEGRVRYATASIGMIGASMSLQLFLVYLNGRKRGASRVCQEAATVILGLKPAIDAFRIVSGDEKREDEPFAPSTEMMLMKCCEM